MGTRISFLVIVAALLLLSSGLVANPQKSPNRFAETRSPIVPQFKSLLLEPGPGFGKSGLDYLPLLMKTPEMISQVNEWLDVQYVALKERTSVASIDLSRAERVNPGQ